ncbi:PfkB family carbohydrate kinase [Amycolatopsis sp. lyj-109]|uniref:PfkB family carbohydrate kinase n=1 Tax=Amycolatopsis sp. lyj-109 TaxID=2789287 RepID=UPI00397E25D5
MAKPDAAVEGVRNVFFKLRTRSGLNVERLSATEVDVALLADLPIVRRYARERAVSTDQAIVDVVTRVTAALEPTDRLIADAVLALGMLAGRPGLPQLYAEDLGERRETLAEHWAALHRLLDVTEIPPAPSVRALRGPVEARALLRLAERCVHGPEAPLPEPAADAREPSNSIVVIGGAVTDVIVVSDELPEIGAAVQADSFEEHPGGKGLNLAVAARRFGLRARLCAAIGGDDAARELTRYMRQEGLSTELIRTTPGEANPRALMLVTQKGETRYLGWMNKGKVSLSTTEFEQPRTKQAIADADAVLITLEPPVETVQWALETAARQTPKPLVLLQASPPMKTPQQLYRHLHGVDYLVGREGELRGLLSYPDRPATVDALADELLTLGVQTVCVVENFGAKIRSRTRSRDIEGPNVPLEDTPGAREAFSAALTFQLLDDGGDLTWDALEWAIRAMTANLTLEEITDSMPGTEDVDRLWRKPDVENP